MQNPLLEAGVVVSPHGIRGEVKIMPWADSPEFLCEFETLIIGNVPMSVLSARIHKNAVIVELEGVSDVNEAEALRSKTVFIDRIDAGLPDDTHFIVDLIGLKAIDDETGAELGTITDILTMNPNKIYVINGQREILVPAVSEFVKKIDVEAGQIRFKLIEGL